MLEVRPFTFRDRVYRSFADRVPPHDDYVIQRVSAELSAIRQGGMEKLAEQEGCGHPAPLAMDMLRISEAEMAASRTLVSESFLTALSLARVGMRKYHEYQRRRGYLHDDGDGVRLARRARPLASVGIIAGNSCANILACAVPAQVAGVGRIALALPPTAKGGPDPHLLAAAKVLGIDEAYRLTGARAVAAFAYGVSPVDRVDKIVGADGLETETAKRLVDGVTGVDGRAPAEELAVVADSSANAKFIAADFLAQAESGRSGFAVLLVTDRLLAEAVRIEMDRLAELHADPARLRETAALRCGLFVCPGLGVALEAANQLAPARMALVTRENDELLPLVDNAGTVYIGQWTCRAAEVFSGANPMAPGWGRVRWASGPGVDDFIQEMTVVEYSPERLQVAGRHIMELALADQRPVAAEAVRERLHLLGNARE